MLASGPSASGGEDVVRLAAEQERIELLEPGADGAAHHLVEQRRLPPAEPGPALGVLLRTAGRLCDAVEHHELVDVDQSHRCSLRSAP